MSTELRNWLARHHLERYAELLDENEIDLEAAGDLTEQDLRELGIAMGPRKKLLRAIATLAAEESIENTQSGTVRVHNQIHASQVHGERRQVTVLFADISGFTRLSGELGAEGTHSLLEAYFGAVDPIIDSFGGTVDKHIGDSVMAVFGAPIAHGNDPERAVRAALSIHNIMPEVARETGIGVKVHIGVASGQVVASKVGSESHYTVTGDSVNLASRLTDQAQANETLLSATVQQAIALEFRTEAVGELSLKGIHEPVRAFKLLSHDPQAVRKSSRPFVGHQAELQQFSALLQSCLESEAGQIICIRGEAGIGKTRLTEEFDRLARQSGFTTHRALVLDFGAGRGQDAIASLVRSLLSVPPSSMGSELSAIAMSASTEGLISAGQEPFLFDLLDLEQKPEIMSLYSAMDNAARNQGKHQTVATLLTTLAKSRPHFIIIEDVHWAERPVLDHLAELARSIPDLPVIMAMTSRIEGDRLDASWRSSIASTPILTMDMRPLRQSDAMQLATEFFDVAGQFAISCVERADGNPLFLEQLLRTAESASEEGVPGSVQSLVQARMDALDIQDKQALQAASILGQRFSLDAVRYLAEDENYQCERLVEKYLIRPDADAYLFAHALVREGVYGSLVAARRVDLHIRAAGWYKDLDPILHAEHLERAAHPSAAQAFLHAAQSQVESSRYDTVADLARRGLSLAEDAKFRCNLAVVLADALLNIGETDEAIKVYKGATRDAVNDKQICASWTGLASAFRVADRQSDALEALEKAEEAALRSGLLSQQAQIHYLRGNLYFPLGRIDECLAEHEASFRLARQVGSLEAEARALSGLGDAHYLRGRMITACENFKACVKLAEEQGYGRIAVANKHMVGWTRIHLMEVQEAFEDGRATAETAHRLSQRRAEVAGLLLAGTTQGKMGNLDAAAEFLERCIECARRIGAANFSANALWELSRVDVASGNIEEGRKHIQQALDLSREFGMAFVGPAVLASWASLREDKESRYDALEEAEKILDSGCVAHNHSWFAEVAIDDALDRQEWDRARHFADRLEAYDKRQPLLLSAFLVKRARVLASWHEDEANPDLRIALESLIEQARKTSYICAIPALERALLV